MGSNLTVCVWQPYILGTRFSHSPDIRQVVLKEAERHLKIAGVVPEGKFHKQGKAVIGRLLREGAISNRTYWDLVENEVGEEMLQKNVFSHCFYGDYITFQSTPMQRCCEQQSALWKKKDSGSLA
jgi:hypothetical protein